MCLYQQEKTKNTNKKNYWIIIKLPSTWFGKQKNCHDIKKLLKISSFSSQFIPSVVLSEAQMLWKYLCYIIFLYRYVSHTARRPSVCVGTEAGVSVIKDAFCAGQSSIKVSRPGPSFFIQRRYRFILVSVAIFTFISSSCSFLYTWKTKTF